MSLTPDSKRILHREKVDDKTLTFSLEKIDTLITEAQAAIPFDSPLVWKDWILRHIASGDLTCVTLDLDGIPIGSLTFAVTGKEIQEMVITHAHIKDHSLGYVPLLVTFCTKLARQYKCRFIRVHTVRKGLVCQLLKHTFNVSEIVLRKEVFPL